jgi:predicted PurR-regulated permease PerM
MKFYNNKKYNVFALYTLLIIAISLLMIIAFFRFHIIVAVFNKMITILTPIIWGLIIAYLLNPIMSFFEDVLKKYVFKKATHKKIIRIIALSLTTILTIVVLAILISIIVPQVIISITNIFNNFPNYVENLEVWIYDILKDNPRLYDLLNGEIENITVYLESVFENLRPLINQIFSDVTMGVFGLLNAIKNFLLGFVISIYLLMSKDTLFAQVKKIMFALFHIKTCEKSIKLYQRINGMFVGFLSGKAVDSLIIAILCFVGMSALNIPYKLLVSLIIGVTNMVPFFGPFIGAIPSGILILLINPDKILAFIIFVIVLQQFDGNILGPRILGNSTGLPALWVLFSILVGGGLFGFLGMLLGVPTFAVMYTLFRSYIENRLLKKKLPIKSSAYFGETKYLYQDDRGNIDEN